jgi:hypothetical protein
MTSFEKFFNILATPIYCMLCIYTSLFCACTAVEPIRDFFSKNLNSVYRACFIGGESSFFGYLTTLGIGIVALITLTIVYREKRWKYISVLLTFIPIMIVVFTLDKQFFIKNDPEYTVLRYVYIINIPLAFASAVVTFSILIKSFVEEKNKKVL